MTTKPLAAVTGAPSGIGDATARASSAAGRPLPATARRIGRVEGLDPPRTVRAEVATPTVRAAAGRRVGAEILGERIANARRRPSKAPARGFRLAPARRA